MTKKERAYIQNQIDYHNQSMKVFFRASLLTSNEVERLEDSIQVRLHDFAATSLRDLLSRFEGGDFDVSLSSSSSGNPSLR